MLPRRFLIALTPLIALVALACGGGGDSADETYLRDLCDANRALEGAVLGGIIGNALEGGDSPAEDPADMLAAFIDPMRDWVEALRAVTPPDDMAAFHAATLDAVDGLLALFAEAETDGDDAESEGMDALLGLFAGFGALTAIPDPPQEALDRLSEAADEVPECNRGLLAGQLLDQFLGGFADGFAITDGDGDGESGADEGAGG